MIQLTPPRLITFVVSPVLAGLVLASLYIRIPSIGQFVGQHRLGTLAAAYIVLALGLSCAVYDPGSTGLRRFRSEA